MSFPGLFRPFLAVLVAGLLATGCAGPRPGAPAPTPEGIFTPEPPPSYRYDGFRLATLNAEFLFDGVDDEGQATFPHKGDPEAARAHRMRVGAVLRGLDADIVMLQEVENRETLELLLGEALAGMGYAAYFVEGQDTFTGQDVALLARVPIDTVGRTDDRAPVEGSDDTYGVSKNLFARLNLGGTPTTLIGVHFLARPDDAGRKPRREAQAEVIRQLVAREQAQGRAVAVMGDFNDFDETTPDRMGSQPITRVLARIKAAGPGPADDLRNVIAEVPQPDRFTSHWDRNRNGAVDADELSAIDHILLSPALYERLQEVHYAQTHDPATHTDHFPIVVVLAR